jgi:glycosyltransferase involved in cell wall biosynthesis
MLGLADESIPTVLVCPKKCDVDSIVLGNVDVIRFPILELPFTNKLNKKLLVEKLRKFNPTILHCLCESRALLTRKIARKLDIPYILMVNSLRKRFSKISISPERCLKIIVPAKSIESNMIHLHPNFKDRIERINIGSFVSTSEHCFPENSSHANIITVHPRHHSEEFENLFNAIRHLYIDGYEFMIVIIDSGKSEDKLWKMLIALGLLQVVTIVPRKMPWRSILASGDIFIRSGSENAFDPLLLGAMSVGSAIAGCKGGVDDLLIEDQTAVIFNPKDELSIMRTLQRLLDRHEFARNIAKNAQEYIKKNHSVSNMISTILKIYNEA